MSAKTSITEFIREKGSPVGTLLLAAVIVGASIGSAARAHADPQNVQVYTEWKAVNICGWFNTHPQVSAVQPMFDAIQHDTGFSVSDTATVLVGAVNGWCPQFMPVLKAYANSAPAPQQVSHVVLR